jgi:DNA-directed RNA polymerase specialized sigma24 family protein
LLLGLPDEEQQLYILHYYYDLQLKEISEILNVNYNTSGPCTCAEWPG